MEPHTDADADADTEADPQTRETKRMRVGSASASGSFLGGCAVPMEPRAHTDADADADGETERMRGSVPLDDCTEMERAVGMKYRANNGIPRFAGILKNRCCDFVVREITPEGEIVRLTDHGEDILAKARAASGGGAAAEDADVDAMRDEGLATMESILGPDSEVATQFRQLVMDERDEPVILPPMAVKADRKRVHTVIREQFKGLVSEFVVIDGQSRISVVRGKEAVRRRRWPEGQPAYLEFVLAKENMSMHDALAVVAGQARINQRTLTYAGNKDKRAVSAQRIRVHRMEAVKLARLNRNLRMIMLGNFRYVDGPLKLGQAGGNHFTITLRNVDLDVTPASVIDANFAGLKKHGSINYFGHQRFGSSGEGATHLVGVRLMQGDYRGAVGMILAPRDNEKPDANAARQYWVSSENDAAGTLERLPKFMRIERAVLQPLVSVGPNAFKNAVEALPRNMVMMFMHAFQSLVWNEMASERARLHGLERVVPGDLVLVADADANANAAEGVDVDVDAADDADDVDGGDGEGEGSNAGDNPSHLPAVHLVVDEEDASKYAMRSVVLPLCGLDTVLPANGSEAVYDEIMKAHSLSAPGCWRPQGGLKGIVLHGGYRRFILHPADLEWHMATYRDHLLPLVPNDIVPVPPAQPQPQPASAAKAETGAGAEAEAEAGREHTAVVVSFSLPPGSYATVLLREVLAGDLAQPSLRKRSVAAGMV